MSRESLNGSQKEFVEGSGRTLRDYVAEAIRGTHVEPLWVKTVESVVRGAKLLQNSAEWKIFEVRYKHRVLEIHIMHERDGVRASTNVDTLTNQPRVAGATTICYLAAKALLQSEADKLDTPIRYEMKTFVDEMAEWDDIRNLFEWQEYSRFADPIWRHFDIHGDQDKADDEDSRLVSASPHRMTTTFLPH